MTDSRCPNPRYKGGWVERGDNESGGAPAFQCQAEGCPHRAERFAQVSQRMLDDAADKFIASMGYDNAKHLKTNISYTACYSDAFRALQRALARDHIANATRDD
jgi:hypothetical protein